MVIIKTVKSDKTVGNTNDDTSTISERETEAERATETQRERDRESHRYREREIERHIERERRSILLTKTTAAQTEVALSYYRVRGLYSLAVVFVATINS